MENPKAPACIASAGDLAHLGDVALVGVLQAMARSPMTKTRTAACGSRAQMSMSRGRRSSASRYCGKDLPLPSQAFVHHGAGDVFDAFHQLDQPLRSAGLQGAKPTPQLPITAVVTPCQDDGAMWLSHTACAS